MREPKTLFTVEFIGDNGARDVSNSTNPKNYILKNRRNIEAVKGLVSGRQFDRWAKFKDARHIRVIVESTLTY